MARAALLALILTLLATFAGAAERSVRLIESVELDKAGTGLRQAISAFEADAASGLPRDWTTVDLNTNRSVEIGRRNYLVMASVEEDAVLLVFLGDQDSPLHGKLARGKETRLGPLDLILVSATPNSSRAQILIRAWMETPVLLEKPVITPSPTRIFANENPREIRISSPDERTADFAVEFLRAMNEGNTALVSAERAREKVSPVVIEELQRVPVYGGAPASNINPDIVGEEYYLPENAQITLRVIRGESSALKELMSSTSYDSEGRMPDNPRVSGRSGAEGGTVSVGRPGDRFQARLRALEASGKLNVESESFARVPIGGSSYFSFSGPQGMVSGEFFVSRRGRDRVQVDIDQESGDWGFLGGVSTRAIFRNGQTIPLARSTASRTTSSKSNTPVFGQIPIIGPIFGNSQETSQNASYALFATVELD